MFLEQNLVFLKAHRRDLLKLLIILFIVLKWSLILLLVPRLS
jgi:hypothetical protein